MKYAVIASLLLAITAVAGPVVGETTPPLRALFLDIVSRTHIPHVYDCSNKAAEYTLALDAKGYTAAMMKTTVRLPNGDEVFHAFVEIRLPLGTIYADPTSGKWSRRILGLTSPGLEYLESPLYLLSPPALRLLRDDPEYATRDPR